MFLRGDAAVILGRAILDSRTPASVADPSRAHGADMLQSV